MYKFLNIDKYKFSVVQDLPLFLAALSSSSLTSSGVS